MIKASTETTKSLLALHGWSAVFLGLLLYVVIFTGTLAVFDEEIGTWSNPLPQTGSSRSVLPPGTDQTLRVIANRIDPAYLDEVALFPSADGRMRILFHTHAVNDAGEHEERGVLTLLNPVSQTIEGEWEGSVDEIFRHQHGSALADFIVGLHVNLLLPGRWGLLLTGVLGFAMLVAVISGFVIHRHLIKELFTLRRRGDRLIAARDSHVNASTWNLPFAFLLAFTGAFFSFGSAAGLPGIAFIAFGGDVDTLIEKVLTPPIPEDASPAPLANIDAMLDDARQRTGTEPTGMLITHWGRRDASVQIATASAEDELLSKNLLYLGEDGQFLGVRPPLGNTESFGGNLASLMTPLHFGDFAGLLSKTVWFAFGFASAYVVFSGLQLWTRRRQDNAGWRWLAYATTWVGYGLPVALVSCTLAFFGRSGISATAHSLLLIVFLAASGVCVLLCHYSGSVERARKHLLLLTAVLLCLAPLARWLSGGPAWSAAWIQGHHLLITVDCLFVIAAILCVRSACSTRIHTSEANNADWVEAR